MAISGMENMMFIKPTTCMYFTDQTGRCLNPWDSSEYEAVYI